MGVYRSKELVGYTERSIKGSGDGIFLIKSTVLEVASATIHKQTAKTTVWVDGNVDLSKFRYLNGI